MYEKIFNNRLYKYLDIFIIKYFDDIFTNILLNIEKVYKAFQSSVRTSISQEIIAKTGKIWILQGESQIFSLYSQTKRNFYLFK